MRYCLFVLKGKFSSYSTGIAYDPVLPRCSNIYENLSLSECVRDNLYQVKDFRSVTGNIYVNQDGNVEGKGYVIKTVREGEFVEYGE